MIAARPEYLHNNPISGVMLAAACSCFHKAGTSAYGLKAVEICSMGLLMVLRMPMPFTSKQERRCSSPAKVEAPPQSTPFMSRKSHPV